MSDKHVAELKRDAYTGIFKKDGYAFAMNPKRLYQIMMRGDRSIPRQSREKFEIEELI